jgi:hypothetical protein
MGAVAINSPSYLTQLKNRRQAERTSTGIAVDRPKNPADSTDFCSAEKQQMAKELSLEEARDLLDWLERKGVDQLAAEIEPSGQFRVIWTQRVSG